jgi:hypothetical protein
VNHYSPIFNSISNSDFHYLFLLSSFCMFHLISTAHLKLITLHLMYMNINVMCTIHFHSFHVIYIQTHCFRLQCPPTPFEIMLCCAFRVVTQCPRVGGGKNTSTVIILYPTELISTVTLASRKRRRKGNPVVSDETLMYRYESSATLTTDRLYYKLQTRPLLREGAPRRRTMQISG